VLDVAKGAKNSRLSVADVGVDGAEAGTQVLVDGSEAPVNFNLVGACGIGELVNGPHDVCVAAFNPLTDSGYLRPDVIDLRRGNRLGFYGSHSVPVAPQAIAAEHGERPHSDEVHKRIVPISVVIIAAPGIHGGHGHGKHRAGAVHFCAVFLFGFCPA